MQAVQHAFACGTACICSVICTAFAAPCAGLVALTSWGSLFITRAKLCLHLLVSTARLDTQKMTLSCAHGT